MESNHNSARTKQTTAPTKLGRVTEFALETSRVPESSTGKCEIVNLKEAGIFLDIYKCPSVINYNFVALLLSSPFYSWVNFRLRLVHLPKNTQLVSGRGGH